MTSMEGPPSQPKNLDPFDESALAELGHRIEGWQAMKDASIPFEERSKRFIHEREAQYQNLLDSNMIVPPDFLETLDRDISEIEAMRGLSEEEIANRCDVMIAESRLVRDQFLSTLR